MTRQKQLRGRLRLGLLLLFIILLLREILLFALQLFYRHHTNPVGTEWKWKMDDPDTIVNGAMDNHRNMIKQFRGTKGPRQCLNNERP